MRDSVDWGRAKDKKQQVCKDGDFLVAEIDRQGGGYGIIPPQLEGAVVSSQLISSSISTSRNLTRFSRLLYKNTGLCAMRKSRHKASTNYAAIRPSHVLDYQIPLPPLPEQRRIVARIEELAAKINEARGLRQKATEETEGARASNADLPSAPHHHWRLNTGPRD